MVKNELKKIGGYFALEAEQRFDNLSGAIALNCARNCLRYVIRVFNIKEIYLPFYTCPAMWQAARKEHCRIKFYHINDTFMPESGFPDNAYILYTNYFGVCAGNVKKLAKQYKNLIVDNAHAFYMPKYGIASFNSLRKFFGVPDGALLYCGKTSVEKLEQDLSYQRFSHLLKRADKDAEFGCKDFDMNEDNFSNEPVKAMSNLTKCIFNSIDIERAKQKRIENYNFLNNTLSGSNILKITLDTDDIPMVYPYLIKNNKLREKLRQNKIYVSTYWNPIMNGKREGVFQRYLLPLPIDQRYDKKDMIRILNVINESLNSA